MPIVLGIWPVSVLLAGVGLPAAGSLIHLLRQHHNQPDRIVGSKFLALRFQALNGIGLSVGLALGALGSP